MNRLYVALGALLVIVALSFTSCSLLKGKVKAEAKAEQSTQVIAHAVAAQKARGKADYQVQRKKAVALDAVRSGAILKESDVKENVDTVDAAVDPWLSMFNSAVRRTNRVITDSVDMP